MPMDGLLPHALFLLLCTRREEDQNSSNSSGDSGRIAASESPWSTQRHAAPPAQQHVKFSHSFINGDANLSCRLRFFRITQVLVTQNNS